ncbi:hypothetical protein EI94DRAFT_1714806 [Lactarius quietus]|nr:hypothetical protein EI94DRAFT_1714806 [Lactarius quietus]
MNATLRDRVIRVEQLFLIAVVAQDETVLQEFSLELSRLIHHFKVVEAGGDLDDNIALLFSRVSQVIQCMLECEDILTNAQTGLMSCTSLPLPSDDLPVSISRATFSSYRLLFSPVSSSGTFGILGNNKLLDACAYHWLMQNMHNPYPTSSQLQIIGDESMTSARDSIGWTSLSDEFFTGSLNATVAAAKRVYLEHDNTVPFCVALAFSKVKAFMETLFARHSALPTVTRHIGCSDQALQPIPVVKDSIHFNNVLDNEEIEDTTPPPSVAGYKRNLPDDTTASVASDLHRPLKRLRARSLHQDHPLSESVHPVSNTSPSFNKSATETFAHTSAIPVTPVLLSEPSSLVESKHSLDSLSTGQRQADLYDSASEMVVDSSHPPASQYKMRNQQIPEGSPQVPSKRQLNPSANHAWDPTLGSVPTFAWPSSPSLDPPAVSTETSQITVSPGIPVDLSVFDWNSIPNPLVEATVSMNQPASVYVPSSNLAAINYELPDPLYLGQSIDKGYNPPYQLDDLGSLEDFSSLLQFPIPTTYPPDVSASTSASFYSDNSIFPSPEMDWQAITDFINQFSSFSAESSSTPSPSATFDAAPSTPENPVGLLLPPPPHEVNKPISVLDSSIPPSVFLPAEPGVFTEDASSMWSLLCGLS